MKNTCTFTKTTHKSQNSPIIYPRLMEWTGKSSSTGMIVLFITSCSGIVIQEGNDKNYNDLKKGESSSLFISDSDDAWIPIPGTLTFE